jgi:hypothetical protein
MIVIRRHASLAKRGTVASGVSASLLRYSDHQFMILVSRSLPPALEDWRCTWSPVCSPDSTLFQEDLSHNFSRGVQADIRDQPDFVLAVSWKSG